MCRAKLITKKEFDPLHPAPHPWYIKNFVPDIIIKDVHDSSGQFTVFLEDKLIYGMEYDMDYG